MRRLTLPGRGQRPPTATPELRRRPALATAAVLLLMLTAILAAADASPLPPAAAAAWGGGWHSWWGAHGKEVAAVTGCFLDGIVAARWLALGGTSMAAAGLLVAAIACFS